MPSMGELAAPVMPSVQAKLAEITGPFNVVAKVTSEPKHADDVAKLIKDVAVLANSDEEEGTLTYRISRGVKESSNTFIVYEEYNAPAALTAHLHSTPFQALSNYPHLLHAEMDIYSEF
ncbi:hypothetical protein E3P92_01995 [Wallemia ichthyophaga]|uniref:ABM domain-containing protein n=1 Tax=Wallemia ichthyophaga TaxID=245174 RepID=A0A4V4LZK8_WALIC|nr:hypothetical protein E3P95_00336 [Wallemia ichthyophaga]TIB05485.1 hypothetical protein E3P94_00336 [Wallemia ichthyophaga]TIB14234.1 hypothetical protein E3P92_01995 [Wallemia ichthyophaga]TIB40008.1 hypothetical protein E3P86_00872 [Wallemia ichthyophaga]